MTDSLTKCEIVLIVEVIVRYRLGIIYKLLDHPHNGLKRDSFSGSGLLLLGVKSSNKHFIFLKSPHPRICVCIYK